MKKALKEAKVHSSWTDPDEAYENCVLAFIRRILTENPGNAFFKDFVLFIQPIIKAGILNSLSQLLIKMTVPGIPDFYQGTELLTLTLVDPDNRQPVDFVHRKHALQEMELKIKQEPEQLCKKLFKESSSGLVKLYVTMRMLQFRRQHPLLFQEGEYIPLEAEGAYAGNVIGYIRRHESGTLIIAAGRFFTQLKEGKITGSGWNGTFLALPPWLEGNFKNLLTGEDCIYLQNRLEISQAFQHFPFAALELKEKKH